MKKTFRFTIFIFAAVLLLLSLGTSQPAAASENKAYDYITFGSYPQSAVKDDALISKLNLMPLTWESYDYMSGDGDMGTMKSGDYMQYADVSYRDEKYRAVRFSSYRPIWICGLPGVDESYQDDNGYKINTVYWFKFEPLKWRIIDRENGLVMCESVIDAQPFTRKIYFNYNRKEYSVFESRMVYPNAYVGLVKIGTIGSGTLEEGEPIYMDFSNGIANWLEYYFRGTAFTDAEKLKIAVTKLDNSACSGKDSKYSCAIASKRVFLLSYNDVLNSKYGFETENVYSLARRAYPTDYAKCQGIYAADGSVDWVLRSAGDSSNTVGIVYFDGSMAQLTVDELHGIRPAFSFGKDSSVFDSGAVIHNYSAWKTVKKATCTTDGLKNRTCSVCNNIESQSIPALGHSYSSLWTIDKAATCTKGGSKSHHCTRCDDKKDVTSIPETGHSFSKWIVSREPTCYAYGKKQRVCTTCKYIQTKNIAKTSHRFKTVKAKATLKADGGVKTVCSVCQAVKSSRVIRKIKTVKLSASSFVYNGKAKTPTVTVKDSKGRTLKKNTDYTVKYSSGRKNIGTYTVTVTFKGNYSGKKSLKFEIAPGKVGSVRQLNKRGINFTWNAVKGASGYEVYYYDANSKKYKELAAVKTNKLGNSGAKGKMTVRVRAYKKVGKQIYYGSFSKPVTFKAK